MDKQDYKFLLDLSRRLYCTDTSKGDENIIITNEQKNHLYDIAYNGLHDNKEILSEVNKNE